MKTFSIVCLLANVLLDWTIAFPIGTPHQNLRGDVSSEPNVVMQSVVVGKKGRPVTEDCDDCPECAYSNMNTLLRRLFQAIHPQSYRYKRERNSKADNETFDENTLERLIEAIEEIKQESKRNRDTEDEFTRNGDEGISRRRRDDPWRRLNDEDGHGNERKEDRESYRGRQADDEEDFHRKKDQEKRRKKHNYKKNEWREVEERQKRHREDLTDSWPQRTAAERLVEEIYNHHRPAAYLA